MGKQSMAIAWKGINAMSKLDPIPLQMELLANKALKSLNQKNYQEGAHLTCYVGNHHLCDYVSYLAEDKNNDCICSCHKEKTQ